MLLFNIVMVTVTGWLGFHFGASITLIDQWPYFEALRTTTSIVFGVMGALLAIVYPEALKKGLRNESLQGNEENLSRVLFPCANSAILLITLVTLAPLFAWVKALDLKAGSDAAAQVQQTAFGLFCVLTYWQVRILQMVLFPLDMLFTNSRKVTATERLRRAIHTNGRGN
ncbi:hypothetical protein RugamoR64_21340 [Duganella rhizosphaerae]|uniref:hypothetical protein n=1 Tax=Duganella rhizosphaerae TaxID=2885763 RepID=UPI0030E9E094